ncbi:MAG: GNAT family N-acetyltransferase [Thermotogota bacterium]
MGESKVLFLKMDVDSYKNYSDYAIKNYADEKVKSGNWSEKEAYNLAKETFDKMLPEGPDTKNNYMYNIYLSENKEHIGYIWFIEQGETAFLADIIIFEDFRGKGYGKEAMKVLEETAKEKGFKKIDLHVFGHNESAFELYKKMGFNITNYRMSKEL